MSDDKTLLSRRTVLKGSGASLGAAAVGVGGLVYSSQPALAASVENDLENDTVTATSDDGDLESVSLDPSVEVSWSNYSSGGLEDITVTVNVDVEDGSEADVIENADAVTVDDGLDEGDLDESSGDVTIDLDEVGNIFDAGIEESDFPSNVGEEESEEQDFDLTFIVDGTAADETIDGDIDTSASATITVEVQNNANTDAVGGDANADADGA